MCQLSLAIDGSRQFSNDHSDHVNESFDSVIDEIDPRLFLKLRHFMGKDEKTEWEISKNFEQTDDENCQGTILLYFSNYPM